MERSLFSSSTSGKNMAPAPESLLMKSAIWLISGLSISSGTRRGASSKSQPFTDMSLGMRWRLKVSAMDPIKAPMAVENSAVLSELSAKEPTEFCPRKMKSASTAVAMARP